MAPKASPFQKESTEGAPLPVAMPPTPAKRTSGFEVGSPGERSLRATRTRASSSDLFGFSLPRQVYCLWIGSVQGTRGARESLRRGESRSLDIRESAAMIHQ